MKSNAEIRWLYVNLGSIKISFNLRDKLDEDRIEYFKELLESGHKLDPVIVTSHNDALHLLDGRHRIEAHRRAGIEQIPYKIEDTPPKYWLMRSFLYNARSAQPLTRKEVARVIMDCSHKYLISEDELIEEFRAICSPSMIQNALRKSRLNRREAAKESARRLNTENGMTVKEIEEITGESRSTISRWIEEDQAGGDNNKIIDIKNHLPASVKAETKGKETEEPDDNTVSESPEPDPEPEVIRKWNYLKPNIEILVKLDAITEKTAFEILAIKENLLISAIQSYHIEISSRPIMATAFALLYLYQKSESTSFDMVRDLEIDYEKAEFIESLVNNMPKVVPERARLFEWVDNNCDDKLSEAQQKLMRDEKYYWTKMAGKEKHPIEVEKKETMYELPSEFFETVNASIVQIATVDIELNRAKVTRKQATEVLELCNSALELINSLLRKLQAYI